MIKVWKAAELQESHCCYKYNYLVTTGMSTQLFIAVESL